MDGTILKSCAEWYEELLDGGLLEDCDVTLRPCDETTMNCEYEDSEVVLRGQSVSSTS